MKLENEKQKIDDFFNRHTDAEIKEKFDKYSWQNKPKKQFFIYSVVTRLKIKIKLFFVYIKWCFNDCIENYQDIKFRYKMETDKELLEIQKELENL